MSVTAPLWHVEGADEHGAMSAQFVALDTQRTSLAMELDDGSAVGVVLTKEDIQNLRHALTQRLIELS